MNASATPPSHVLPTGAASDDAARRRRVRNTALRLTLFAIVVYVGFIAAFVHWHS